MRIAIAAGHSANTTGERKWEFDQCLIVENYLGQLLEWAGYEVISPEAQVYELPNDDALREKIRYFNQQEAQLAVELHINAGGGDYSCAIHTDHGGFESPKGKVLSARIAEELEVFPWRSIGGKPESYFQRSLGFLQYTHCPACIVEAGFKDHAYHRLILGSTSGHTMYAAAVYSGIERYLRDISS